MSHPLSATRGHPFVPNLPGLLACGVFGACAMFLGRQPWFAAHGLSALSLAIVLGLLLGNSLYPRVARPLAPGVNLARQRLLRIGIVLFGLRLSFQDVAAVGFAAVVIDALMLSSTFALAWWAGERWFGLDRDTAVLIGAGSAICGAAAVMATEPLLKSRLEAVAVAVATVVVFGTLAMLLYPALYQWNLNAGWLPVTALDYGVYVGSTVHEVAQVLVAGAAVNDTAANTAVITKMVRVMMLAPFLLILAWMLARRAQARVKPQGSNPAQGKHRIRVPWFALGFVLVVALNSTPLIPKSLVPAALLVDEWMLATAMFALGLGTHVSAIRQAGVRPLALAALLALWLLAGGFLANLVGAWLR